MVSSRRIHAIRVACESHRRAVVVSPGQEPANSSTVSSPLSRSQVSSVGTHHFTCAAATMSAIVLIEDLRPVQALLAVFAAALCSLIGLSIYRLTLHALAKIPGPRIAAATGAYEAYFQLIKEGGGRYWPEVERMHRLYGVCLPPSSPAFGMAAHEICRSNREDQSVGSPHQGP